MKKLILTFFVLVCSVFTNASEPVNLRINSWEFGSLMLEYNGRLDVDNIRSEASSNSIFVDDGTGEFIQCWERDLRGDGLISISVFNYACVIEGRTRLENTPLAEHLFGALEWMANHFAGQRIVNPIEGSTGFAYKENEGGQLACWKNDPSTGNVTCEFDNPDQFADSQDSPFSDLHFSIFLGDSDLSSLLVGAMNDSDLREKYYIGGHEVSGVNRKSIYENSYDDKWIACWKRELETPRLNCSLEISNVIAGKMGRFIYDAIVWADDYPDYWGMISISSHADEVRLESEVGLIFTCTKRERDHQAPFVRCEVENLMGEENEN